jgi:hypothetical protein
MADGKIVIKKWKIFLRKLVEGSQSSIARFRSWLQQLVGRWRENKSYRTLNINSEIKKRELPPGTRDPIRIVQRPAQRGSEQSTRPRVPGRSTPDDGRAGRTPGMPKRTNRIQVNSENGKMCPACTIEITADDATAKCRTNRDHIIHRRCTTLVKNQCPTCKGYIA